MHFDLTAHAFDSADVDVFGFMHAIRWQHRLKSGDLTLFEGSSKRHYRTMQCDAKDCRLIDGPGQAARKVSWKRLKVPAAEF